MVVVNIHLAGNSTSLCDLPPGRGWGHERGVVDEAEGGTAGEEFVTGEYLLGSTFAFHAKPELDALGSGCFGTIDSIDLGDVIDTFFGSASVAIDHDPIQWI